MRMFALIAASLPLVALAAPAAAPNLDGAWEGALKVGGIQLRVVAKIKKSGDKWTATLDSPDQGAKDIPVDEVKLEGQKLTLTLPKIMAKFEGTLAGDKVTGTWSQGMGTLPLELVKTDHPAAVGP